MEQKTVVITSRVHEEVLELLKKHFQVLANAGTEPWPAELWLRHVSQADGLMTFMSDHIGREILQHCPRLRVIACALKGCDNFDLAACRERGISVSCAEELLTGPVADLTVGLLISLSRNIVAGDQLVRRGEFTGWRPHLYGAGLSDSTVGFIGMGGIGQATALRVQAFGCSIVYFDQRHLEPDLERDLRAKFLPLDQLISTSDFLVLALPLGPRTFHLVDREFLSRVKPGASIINPARGSLVDENAIADALRSGRLGGYAADVFECEDWARPDRPSAIPAELLHSERTVLTPHLGSAVDNIRLAVETHAAQTLIDYFTSHCAESKRSGEAY